MQKRHWNKRESLFKLRLFFSILSENKVNSDDKKLIISTPKNTKKLLV